MEQYMGKYSSICVGRKASKLRLVLACRVDDV